MELVLILALAAVAILVLLVGIPLVIVRAFRGATRHASGATGPPEDQRPPPGYWWDGEKWNPPGEIGD